MHILKFLAIGRQGLHAILEDCGSSVLLPFQSVPYREDEARLEQRGVLLLPSVREEYKEERITRLWLRIVRCSSATLILGIVLESSSSSQGALALSGAALLLPLARFRVCDLLLVV